MSGKEYAIPKGSRILVTGANGSIASNVIDILLDLGYTVRGTVRTEKPWLDRLFEAKYGKGRFEGVVVGTIEQDGAFDNAIKDVAGLVHVVCTSQHRFHPIVHWTIADGS
jgi:Nucleoside-diphosphate-sugar epimerases